MSIVTLLVMHLVGCAYSAPAGALYDGRPLSWDPLGAVPLNHEGRQTEQDDKCLQLMLLADIGRASEIARRVLETTDDLVCGWVVWQGARLRHTTQTDLVWLGSLTKKHPRSLGAAIAYSKIYDRMLRERAASDRKHGGVFGPELAESNNARERCLALSEDNLAGLVSVTEDPTFSPSERRELLANYVTRHPQDTAARLAWIRACFRGWGIVLTKQERQSGLPVFNPEGYQTDQGIALASALLKNDPKLPLARYWLARGLLRKKRPEGLRTLKALSTEPTICAPLRNCIRRYLQDGLETDFRGPFPD